MKYNFDSIIDRKNTNSLKWDLLDDEYPMWVADMDFYAAPKIYESVNRKAKHGVYAYSFVNEDVFESYINWWKKYGLLMKKDELLFATGVMPSITSIIRAFTDVGDNVLIQTPVYHVFFYVILDNDRNVVENQLIYDSDCDDVDSVYTIDFDDLEEKFKDPKTKLMILCNPHNPIGKIWEKGDLEKIAVLAKRHDVIVVSDEIHCDLTDPDLAYVPFASLDEELSKNSITCISPSKTFNIAGLQSSAVFTRNKELYEVLEKQLAVDCFNHPNIFSIDATIAAYKSEDWLNELREVLFENKMIVDEFLKSEIPEIRLVPANATYLLWLDCSKLNMDDCDGEFSNILSEFLREEVGLFLSPGVQFGQNGDNFLRMNIACPKELLLEGLNALKIGIEKFKKKIIFEKNSN